MKKVPDNLGAIAQSMIARGVAQEDLDYTIGLVMSAGAALGDRLVGHRSRKGIHDRLKQIGLESFCKTTGGKGLHVVTPISVGKSNLGWDEAKTFAQAVCARMADDSPDKCLIKMTKKLRTGRIFLDYLRNDRMSTAVAPLSPRARPGAPVSMPVDWAKVRKGLDPLRYTMRTAPGLLSKTKPWEGYKDASRPLAPAIRKLLARL